MATPTPMQFVITVKDNGTAVIQNFAKQANSTMNQIPGAANQAASAVKNVGAALQQSGNQAAAAAQKSQQVSKSWMALYAQSSMAIGAFGMISRAVVGNITEFNKYEDSVARLRAITLTSTGRIGEGFEGLKDKAVSMSETMRYSATEVTNAMAYMKQFGLSDSSVSRNIKSVMDLASVEMLSVEQASRIALSVQTSLGKGSEDLTKALDTLTVASAESGAALSDLGEAWKYIGVNPRLSKVTLEETASALMSLADAGIRGSMAGTTLRAAFNRLHSPTGAAKKALQELGLMTNDGEKKFKNFIDVLDKLENNIDKMKYLKVIFGDRAMTGLAAISEDMRKFYDQVERLISAEGRLTMMGDERNKGLAGATDRASNAFRNMSNAIVEVLSPHLVNLLDSTSHVVNFIKRFVKFFDGGQLKGAGNAKPQEFEQSQGDDRFWSNFAGNSPEVRRYIEDAKSRREDTARNWMNARGMAGDNWWAFKRLFTHGLQGSNFTSAQPITDKLLESYKRNKRNQSLQDRNMLMVSELGVPTLQEILQPMKNWGQREEANKGSLEMATKMGLGIAGTMGLSGIPGTGFFAEEDKALKKRTEIQLELARKKQEREEQATRDRLKREEKDREESIKSAKKEADAKAKIMQEYYESVDQMYKGHVTRKAEMDEARGEMSLIKAELMVPESELDLLADRMETVNSIFENAANSQEAILFQNASRTHVALLRKVKMFSDANKTELNLEKAKQQLMFGIAFEGMKALTDVFIHGTEGRFKAMKAIASAEALVNTFLAVTQVLADPNIKDPFTKTAAATAIGAIGLAKVAAINMAEIGNTGGGDLGSGASIPSDASGEVSSGPSFDSPSTRDVVLAGSGRTIIANINVDGFVGSEANLASKIAEVMREAVGDDLNTGLTVSRSR